MYSYNLYNKDIQTFGKCFFDFIVKRRELGLIFYALLDPAFCCYNEVVQLCNSKQLRGPINGYDAQIIANLVVPTTASQFLTNKALNPREGMAGCLRPQTDLAPE